MHNYFIVEWMILINYKLVDFFIKELKYIDINLSYNTNIKIDTISLVYAFNDTQKINKVI